MLKKLSEDKICFLIYLSFLLIPIKLSFAYAGILPLILIYILRDFSVKDLFYKGYKFLAYFIIAIFLLTPFSFNFIESISATSSFAYYSLLILAVNKYLKKEKLVFAISLMCLGQTISSCHTILQEAFGSKIIPEFFVGKLSEAGQLALTIPLMFGLVLTKKENTIQKKDIAFFALFFIINILLGFLGQNDKKLGAMLMLIPFIVFLAIGVIQVLKTKNIVSIKNYIYLYCPICLSSFLLNLKRGPWGGVIIVLIFLVFKYNKKLLIIFSSFIICIFALVTPVRERALSSIDHFFIYGGRYSIWRVGTDLATRYPLGIGYKQSSNLSSYSVDIPSNLKHFHNNLFNIEVEFGVICLVLYICWIVSVLRLGTSNKDNLSFIISLAFLSSQIAGLVEYNLGDSEIFLLMCLLLGILVKEGSCELKRDEVDNINSIS